MNQAARTHSKSNRARIGDAIDAVLPGLRRFVERELGQRFGEQWEQRALAKLRSPPSEDEPDPLTDLKTLLDLIVAHWDQVFRTSLPPDARSWVFELKAIRNRWAHGGGFTDTAAQRALDTFQQVLMAAGAGRAAEIEVDQRELQGESSGGPGATTDAGFDRTLAGLQPGRVDAHEGVDSPTSVVSTIPASIPLVGRSGELTELRQLLLAGDRTILIHGPGGVGKSVLAKALAHSIIADRTEFADLRHFHWISVKATDSAEARDLHWLIARLHRALGFVTSAEGEADEMREMAIKHVLSQTPTFLVIDNFETVADDATIDWLLGLPGSTRIVLTSRVALDPTLSLASYPLRHLDTPMTIALLRQECARLRLTTVKEEQATRIATATAGSPLAIRWTTGLLAEGYSVERAMAVLDEGSDDLFETLFADHWRSLGDGARDTLCAVSLLGDTFARPLADSILDAPREMGELVRRNLVEPWDEPADGTRRFTLHPLTRAFARRHVTGAERNTALALASGAALSRYFAERKSLQYGRGAYLSLDHDIASVLKIDRVVAPEATSGPDTKAAEQLVALFEAVSVPLWTLGYWERRVELACHAVDAAELCGYWDAAARAAGTAAIVRYWQGSLDEAESFGREALRFAGHSEDPLDRAVGDRVLALVAARRGRVDDGVASLNAILGVLRDCANIAIEKVRFFADWPCPGSRGHEAGLVALQQETGIILISASRSKEAFTWLNASRDLAVDIGDDEGLSISLSHLGRAFFALEQIDEAEEHFAEGLQLALSVGRRSTTGRCLLGLAEVSALKGDRPRAVQHAGEAAAVFSRLGMREEQRVAEDILK